MRWQQIPYLLRTMRTEHPAIGIKQQLRPNSSPPNRLAKTGTNQLETIHTIFDRNWTIEQDTPDQSTDRKDASLLGMTATYSDVTNLITPGPITADGHHRRCAMTRPAIEASHTLSASQVRCWITNSPRGSSPSILNHMTKQPILQCESKILFSTSTWPEEMTSTLSNTSH